jgi:integrase
MASTKKFPGSKHWFACFKLPTGQVDSRGRAIFRRVQRSTGLTDETRALQVAISCERAALAAAEKRWTERSARLFLQELNILAGVQVDEVEPTDTFLQRWLTGKKHTIAARSFLNFESIVGDFLEHLGARKGAPLIEITPRVVAGFRDTELSVGKSPTTVNKALGILGQAFDEAVTTQVMTVNPARGLRVKGADRRAQKRQAFTFEQFRALIQATAPGAKSVRGAQIHSEWQTFILVAGYTGARQQEAAKLKWTDVEFAKQAIALRRSKNGDVHWMPLHPSLEAHLRRRAAGCGGERSVFVMPYVAGLQERQISKYFRDMILPRIGIHQPYRKPNAVAAKSAGRKLAEFGVHSLRHSLATWLDEAGVSEMMRMRIIGHEDEDVSRRYTHSNHAKAAAELAKVPPV